MRSMSLRVAAPNELTQLSSPAASPVTLLTAGPLTRPEPNALHRGRYLGRFSKTFFATGSAEKALGQPT
jgi:hypothetical protein